MTKPAPFPPELQLLLEATVDSRKLGKMLRAVRAAENVTQSELGRRIGVPYQNVSRLENGDREGMITTINKYLRALGWELVIVARPRRRGGKPRRAASSDGKGR